MIGKKEVIGKTHNGKTDSGHKIIYSILHHHPEFNLKDLLQVIIGASILAIPVGFTEETWKLGETLPMRNIIGLLLLSITFVTAFVFYNYHHKHHKVKDYKVVFFERVLATYVVSFILVSVLLALIQKTPWVTDWALAFKRVVIVSFPCSMSAAVADVLK